MHVSELSKEKKMFHGAEKKQVSELYKHERKDYFSYEGESSRSSFH